MDTPILTATLTIIGTVLAVGIALAGLIMCSTARTDRRIDRAEDRFERAMAAFRTEMQRLAERQSHVEGRLDECGSTVH